MCSLFVVFYFGALVIRFGGRHVCAISRCGVRCVAFRQSLLLLLLLLLLPLLLCSHCHVGDADRTGDVDEDNAAEDYIRCVVCASVCACVCFDPRPRFLLLYVVVAKLTVANASYVVRLMYCHLMHLLSDRCLLHPRSAHTVTLGYPAHKAFGVPK